MTIVLEVLDEKAPALLEVLESISFVESIIADGKELPREVDKELIPTKAK